MVLHDNFFLSVKQTINQSSTIKPITVSYSSLFQSTWTLLISLIGFIMNFIGFVKLFRIILKYKQRKKSLRNREKFPSVHILSHRKYDFLLAIIANNLLLSLLSLISCFDEQYFHQTLIARAHLCSTNMFLWKFSLHFLPLLTIFILCRYHYKLTKNFPQRHFNTTTSNQLLCTDLCIVICFVLALAWSVDGLWLWGESKLDDFIQPEHLRNETNDESNAAGLSYSQFELSDGKIGVNYLEKFQNQQLYSICYIQLNNNFNFTTRILNLVKADYVFMFVLHFIGEPDPLIMKIHLTIRMKFILIDNNFSRYDEFAQVELLPKSCFSFL